MSAAIAQLVERNLAKVEVASPSLVCRSFYVADLEKTMISALLFFPLSNSKTPTRKDEFIFEIF